MSNKKKLSDIVTPTVAVVSLLFSVILTVGGGVVGIMTQISKIESRVAGIENNLEEYKIDAEALQDLRTSYAVISDRVTHNTNSIVEQAGVLKKITDQLQAMDRNNVANVEAQQRLVATVQKIAEDCSELQLSVREVQVKLDIIFKQKQKK